MSVCVYLRTCRRIRHTNTEIREDLLVCWHCVTCCATTCGVLRVLPCLVRVRVVPLRVQSHIKRWLMNTHRVPLVDAPMRILLCTDMNPVPYKNITINTHKPATGRLRNGIARNYFNRKSVNIHSRPTTCLCGRTSHKVPQCPIESLARCHFTRRVCTECDSNFCVTKTCILHHVRRTVGGSNMPTKRQWIEMEINVCVRGSVFFSALSSPTHRLRLQYRTMQRILCLWWG